MAIRVAIFGVGNCAKSLVQGTARYAQTGETAGLAFPVIGGYTPKDIYFALAYDVDARKVDKKIEEAICAPPNCASDILGGDVADVCSHGPVRRGPVLDGVAEHMRGQSPTDSERFYVHYNRQEPSVDLVAADLRDQKVDVALIYLPVGSTRAVHFYVEACLAARVPFVNCIPVFVVSDPEWQGRIRRAGIPAIGDDMRSQVGASVLSQVLQEMFLCRGATVKFHCQTNEGGNTDFHNMMDRSRLEGKRRSKEGVITSQNTLKGVTAPPNGVYAGPATYIPYLRDNKVAHLRIEAEGFGGAPITLDCRLSVQDSPNSAGVVIDAIRYLKVAGERGMAGPLVEVSAYTQKTPPQQMTLADAWLACAALAGPQPGVGPVQKETPGN